MVKFWTFIAASLCAGFLWAGDIILPQDLVKALPEGTYDILDVRTEAEFKAGHIQGAKWVPHDQAGRVASLLSQSEKPLVVYCRSGRRARLAAKTLQSKGVNRPIVFLEGDYPAWEMFGYPTLQGVRPEENLRR